MGLTKFLKGVNLSVFVDPSAVEYLVMLKSG